MKLSALEIKSQEFKRTLRGLDEAEVQSFLDMVASQWQELQDDLRRNEERVRELENKIVHYQKIEEALQEALTSAKASSKATVAEAERKAELVVQEAEIRARALSREAEGQVREMHDSATTIGRRRKQIVARLRAFLNAELELLAEYAESQGRDQIPPLPERLQSPPADPVQNAYEAAMHQRTTPAPAMPVRNGSDENYQNESAAPVEFEAEDVHNQHGDEQADFVDEQPEYAEEFVADEQPAQDYSDEAAEIEHEDDEQHERGPVEHQRHAPSESTFESEAETEQADVDDDDISPENTEWRIRRILDNLE